jgi:predicted glycosyl hydrolase (DUF1957 family)
MIAYMKIKPEDQTKLEELIQSNLSLYNCQTIGEFIRKYKRAVEDGHFKVIRCEATNCFGRLLKGEALSFVCDEIYKYADDIHLQTLYKKLYKKYS